MARDTAWTTWTDVAEACGEKPVTITQAGITFHGHWHNEFAVFADDTLKAGWGWLGRQGHKRVVERFCALNGRGIR